MRSPQFVAPLVYSVCTLLVNSGFAQEQTPGGAKQAKQPQEAKDTEFNGVFEAVQSAELSAGTEKLTSLVISKIVPHGTSVRQGQNIVWFETKDLDEKIHEAEVNLQLAKLTLQEEEFGFKQFLATQKLDKAAAERTRKAARQAHDNFVRVDRDRSVATAKYSLKSSTVSLENVLEELKQLEQMYKEDELTEESEEIVLKRARYAVESAQFRLEGTKTQTERSLKQLIPLQTAQQDETFARAELTYRKSIRSLETARQRQDIEMTRKRDKFRKEQETLTAMQAERRQLVLTAPHDGIVYHGALTRGKLSDKPGAFRNGTVATAKQVLATIVNPARLQIRVDLTETLLNQVRVGMQGKVTAGALTAQNLTGHVKSVARIPYANNKFDCVLTLKGKTTGIAPGTSCVVKLPNEKK